MALIRPSATARLQLSTLVSTSRAASPWEWSVDVHGGGTAASPSQPRHVLLFLSGWPDDKRAWTPTAQAVASDEIMCGVICMPGHEDVASARKGIPGGFDIEDVVTIVEKTAEKLLQHASCSKLTLVLHDWGCYFGSLFSNRRPDLVNGILLVDIGLGRSDETFLDALLSAKKGKVAETNTKATTDPHLQQTTAGTVRLVIYQLWFASAYLLGRYTSACVGDMFLKTYFALASFLPFVGAWWNFWTMTSKSAPGMKPMRPSAEITSYLGYPYWMVWSRILRGGSPPKPRAPDDLDATPVVFLYGKMKKVFFHTASFLRDVAQHSPPCKVVGFDCGHWVMDAFPAEVVREVRALLSTLEKRTKL